MTNPDLMELRVLEPPAAAPAPEPLRQSSPLAEARLRRQLTLDEASRRAGITTDEAEWLEEGRVYRFASADRALLAALLYATALGIDHREARELAGLPVPPKPLERNVHGRLIFAGAVTLALVALVAVIFVGVGGSAKQAGFSSNVALPPPWKISVRVLNGSGDINYTRQQANRIQALGYKLGFVGRANNFGYRQTVVYFPPDGEAVGNRLAHELGVPLEPLPGGSNPLQLVVIVGPAHVTG